MYLHSYACKYSVHPLLQESNGDDLGKVFANRDAVHILTYAIMMLNTDLHSNQVKKKMTLEVHVLRCEI